MPTKNSHMRLLIVEDTEDLADALLHRFRRLGYAVDWVSDGMSAVDLLKLEPFDLIVLDLMLPRLGGWEVLRRFRQHNKRTPVIILTARGEVFNKVALLDLGADDYLVKPFDMQELEARVRALLRRPKGHAESVLSAGNLRLDLAAQRVHIDDREILLSLREFRLLELFLCDFGRLMTKSSILDRMYGAEEAVAPNAVELYVSRLRHKLEGATLTIRTVRGAGYIASVDANR